MNKEKMIEYAKVIAKVGANVQKGQEVFITCNIEDEYFVELLVEECYKIGAKKVTVEWNSPKVTKLNLKYQDIESLKEVPHYIVDTWKYKGEVLPATIWIDSDDPDAYKGIDANKIMTRSNSIRKAVRPIRKEMENKYQWTIAAIPSKNWALKLFPELSEEEAINKLWEVIIKCARCSSDDPFKEWDLHNQELKDKCAWLNSLGIDYLEYKNSLGTNLKVSLHKVGQFVSGISYTLSGNNYNPNMPTEECFTSPVKESTTGVVYASKPLSLNGVVLTDFGFRFENGRVVEVIAKDEVTKTMLTELVNADDGAHMLGEVALVPFNSPVNESGILFYNTLFDENACCHFAVGMGFEECIKDFDKLSREEIDKVGINESTIHIDFMIGTADLSIVAHTFDNKEIPIFKNGTWA